jgi:hypothetical protein
MASLLGRFSKRSAFDLSHSKVLTFPLGKLVPIMCEEVLPGDTFKVNTEMLIRLKPLVAPVMHEINVYTHYFFVPNRLLWKNWESFITCGSDGKYVYVYPYFYSPDITGFPVSSLGDYFGLPYDASIASGSTFAVSALPFRAYALIYNEWYRNQNLQEEVSLSLDDGLDTVTNTSLLSRNWEKDYFTSALPWPQRGDPAMLPLGVEAPLLPGYLPVLAADPGTGTAYTANTSPIVLTLTTTAGSYEYNAYVIQPNSEIIFGLSTFSVDVYTCDLSIVDAGSGLAFYNLSVRPGHGGARGSSANVPYTLSGGTVPLPERVDLSGAIADLSQATAVQINDLRLAEKVQVWSEVNARAGVRYVESILGHFGVRSSDARLQRPEYLGGGRSPIIVSEVLQTSSTDTTSPQGNMSGHALSARRDHAFTKSFEEHGFIIGIVSVIPRTMYSQGLPRKFSRRTRYDYYWPEFSHLGEQAVLEKELYAFGDDDGRDSVFGYSPRYDEYRHSFSSVHGQFRTALDYWNMSRSFSNAPTLSSQFVTSDPTQRIFEEQTTDPCYVQLMHHVTAIRPMPVAASPSLT